MSVLRILIVEDEAIIAADLQRRLSGFGHHPIALADSCEAACQLASELRPDLVLMDIVLKGASDGIEAARWIRDKLEIPVLYLTSHTDPNTIRQACAAEPFGYVLKPIDDRDLRVSLEVAAQRHRSEARLRQLQRWLNTTLESIGDGVIAVDADGLITLMNPPAEALTGWRRNEAQGRPLEEVFRLQHSATGQTLPNPAAAAIRDGRVVHIDRQSVLQSRAGSSCPIDDSAAPIRTEDGDIRGAVVVFRDATDRVRVEEKLRDLNESLQSQVDRRTAELTAVVQDLDQFTGSVSHDLQAPVRAIEGYASILARHLEATPSPEAQVLLGKIQEGARQMATMIAAFQRLARLQRQDISEAQIDMGRLAAETVASLQPDQMTPRPSVEIGPLPPARGDVELIRQVWANLIGNALKYSRKTARPQIWIGAEQKDGAWVYFVRDNGAGFDPQYADRLFIPFQRLHPHALFEGQGLGLATVNRILQRHGGRIWAEAAPQQGATFRFTLAGIDRAVTPALPSQAALESFQRPAADLPAAPTPTAPATPAERAQGHARPASNPKPARRILIVEDEAIIAADLDARLVQLGFTVAGTAASGAEAIELARRLLPSLVLMDIQLGPGLDGTEAAALIHEELLIPVVFLTSHSDPATFERARTVKPFGYVLKPVQDRELGMAIELALTRSEADRRIAQSQRWLHATLRAIGDGVIATNAQGRIVFLNAAAEKLLDWKESDALERELTEILLVRDPHTGHTVPSPVALSLKAGTPGAIPSDALLVGRRQVTVPASSCASLIRDEHRRVVGGIVVFRDISERRAAEAEREQMITALRDALQQVKTLRGLLPVCAWCRQVRNDDGYWQQFEEYIREHTAASITHSICPACAHRIIPEGEQEPQ